MTSMAIGEKGRERRERHRRRTRDAILDAARDRFRDEGFREAKVEDIADDADVSIGSLYRHFATKEQLYRDAFRDGVEQTKTQLSEMGELLELSIKTDRKYLRRAYDERKSVVEQLEAIGKAYLQFGIEHPLYFELVTIPGAFGALDEKDEQSLADGVQGLVDGVAKLIKSGICSDPPEVAIPPALRREWDADSFAEAAADFLHGAWNGLIALSLRGDRVKITDERLEELVRVGIEIVRDGMSAEPPRRAKGGAQAPQPPG